MQQCLSSLIAGNWLCSPVAVRCCISLSSRPMLCLGGFCNLSGDLFAGTLPVLKLPKAIQFNCNFCALSGSFPDMFAGLPSLQITYWDGNGFTGRLPPSLSVAAKLTRLSFNVNQFEGDIPPGICNIPAGDGPDTPDVAHDCRIGSDTSLEAYSANYPWIIKGHGNLYNCATIPECARVGSCNKTNGVKIVNPLSPVLCK